MRSLLKRRFYVFIVLAGFTVFTGVATGYEFLYRLAYVLGLTVILAFAWNWLSLQWLSVQVFRRTARVHVGDPIEERITIENRGGFPKPLLEVEDLSDLPGYFSAVVISVSAKSFRSWRTTAPARKRGVYTMGPVRVANTDPFGLFYRERLFCGTESLTVYPRTVNLPEFALSAANLSGDSSRRKRTHNLTPHAGSVRDYASGDSLSRIHWNSTARMGKLMSKEFDLGRSSDVWIFIDLSAEVQAGELEESTDEYAVTISASLAKKYLEANLPVGIVAYGDQRYYLPSDTGIGHMDRIMEHLAMSKAEGDTPLATALPKEEALWSYHSSLVVVTPSHVPHWVNGLKELAKRRVRVAVVLLDGSSFGGYFEPTEPLQELYLAGIPTYRVGKGDTLAIALSQLASPQGPMAERSLTVAGQSL